MAMGVAIRIAKHRNLPRTAASWIMKYLRVEYVVLVLFVILANIVGRCVLFWGEVGSWQANLSI